MGRVRSGREVDAALRKKGFQRDSEGKHIRYYLVNPDGREAGIRTMMSHGIMGGTLSSKLVSDMARQLHLTKAQFLDLVDCPLDETAYRDILRERGFTV